MGLRFKGLVFGAYGVRFSVSGLGVGVEWLGVEGAGF